jgi:hypothetical protein
MGGQVSCPVAPAYAAPVQVAPPRPVAPRLASSDMPPTVPTAVVVFVVVFVLATAWREWLDTGVRSQLHTSCVRAPPGRFMAMVRTAAHTLDNLVRHRRFVAQGVYALATDAPWSQELAGQVHGRFQSSVSADVDAPVVAFGTWGPAEDPVAPAIEQGWAFQSWARCGLRILALYPPHTRAPIPRVPGAIAVVTNEHCDYAWRSWYVFAHATRPLRALYRLLCVPDPVLDPPWLRHYSRAQDLRALGCSEF